MTSKATPGSSTVSRTSKDQVVMQRHVDIDLVALSAAVLTLVFGVTVYVFGRGGEALFVPPLLRDGNVTIPVIAGIGGSLPSFLHTFAFATFSALVVNASGASLSRICVFWVGLESAIEIGQTHVVALWISDAMPRWASDFLILDSVRTFFLNGTFDVLDVVAIAVGGCGVYLLKGGRSRCLRGSHHS